MADRDAHNTEDDMLPISGGTPADERPWLGIPATILQGLRPFHCAPPLAGAGSVAPAWRFALLVTLPLTLLSGVIPFTHGLHFGSSFALEVEGDALTDVARAVGIAALVGAASFGVLGASFVSLAGAFGTQRKGGAPAKVAALRAVLFRSWLFPMAGLYGLPLMFMMWALPSMVDHPIVGTLLGLMVMIPLALLSLNLHGAARHACGCSHGSAILIAVLPVVLFCLVQLIFVGDPPGTGILESWLPQIPPPPIE